MCLSTPLRSAKSKSALLLPATSSKDSLQGTPRNDTLPSRDEAIQMILSSRWWDPSMGAPLPLASLLSHNSTQDAGWLKCLLFPAAGTSNIPDCFDEKLALSYLLIIAESEGLAQKLAEAWSETEESAKAITKNTIATFAYHPILKNFPHEYHVSTEPLTFLFSLFPSGCLGCLDKDAGKLAVVFLDAALFRRGRCHSNHVKRLFIDCDGSTIGTIRNKVVGDLFCHFADFEILHVPSKSLTPPKYTAIKASRQAITDRSPLAAVNRHSIQPRADRRLKRQHSVSHQQNKKKTKPDKEN